jgi:hypothetical protein
VPFWRPNRRTCQCGQTVKMPQPSKKKRTPSQFKFLRHFLSLGETSAFFSAEKFLWPDKHVLQDLETEIASQSGTRQNSDQIIEWVRDDKDVIQIRLNSKLQELKHKACSQRRSRTIAASCRTLNNTLQTQQVSWHKMRAISQALDALKAKETNVLAEIAADRYTFSEFKGGPFLANPYFEQQGDVVKEMLLERTKAERQEVESKQKELIDYLHSIAKPNREHGPFLPGPVGDLPLHDCFLLDLNDAGRQVMETFYNNAKLLSLEYKNDLDPWRISSNSAKANDSGENWEDGLYTGETVLHIAIVKENLDLVKLFLAKGINLSSRARGAFFQPKWIRPRVHELTMWQKCVAYVGGIDLNVEMFAAVKQQQNESSG